MNERLVQIRRYPNRRFYARHESRYVSLQEIEQLIQDGKTVEIRDSQTDEDVTRVVLAQLILKQQPEKMALFPVDMLHFILRSNELMSGFLRDYFRQSLAYLDYLQSHGAELPPLGPPRHWMRALWQGILPRQTDQTDPEQQAEQAEQVEQVEQVEQAEQAEQAGQSAAPRPPAPSVAEMQRRMAELEARIRQLESKEAGGRDS